MIKRSILFVYSNMGDGGTQRQKSILSRELSKKYNLTMALFKNEQMHQFDGKIIDLKAPTTRNYLLLFFNVIRRIYMLRKLFKSNKYDIVISSSIVSNTFSLLVKCLFRINIPVIITFNNANKLKSDDMGISGKIATLLNKKLSSSADLIVTVSNALRDELLNEKYPVQKVRTIYNGIDIDEIIKLSKEKIQGNHSEIFKRKTFKIIAIGRLSKQKDYFTLLKAFETLKKEFTVELIILGDGELRKELLDYVVKNDLAECVHLLGWVKNPYKYLKKSDIFVLSSLWEGFPNVILEALCCGLPVVSTDCLTGPGEIINSGENGFLVSVGDYAALADRIAELLKTNKTAVTIRKNGSKRVREFGIQEKASEWSKVLNSLISAK